MVGLTEIASPISYREFQQRDEKILDKLVETQHMYFLAGKEREWEKAFETAGISTKISTHEANLRSIPFAHVAKLLEACIEPKQTQISIDDFLHLVNDSITQQVREENPQTALVNYNDALYHYLYETQQAQREGIENTNILEAQKETTETSAIMRLYVSAAIVNKSLEALAPLEIMASYLRIPAKEENLSETERLRLNAAHDLKEKTRIFGSANSIQATINTLNQLDEHADLLHRIVKHLPQEPRAIRVRLS